MRLLKDRPLALATAFLIVFAILGTLLPSLAKIFLFFGIFALGIVLFGICIGKRSCGGRMTTALLCILFSLGTLGSSYLYFDRSLGEWQNYAGEEVTVEGVILGRDSSYTFAAELYEVRGKREKVRVKLECAEPSALQEGETFRLRGSVPEEAFAGDGDGNVGILLCNDPKDCTVTGKDESRLSLRFRRWNRELSDRLETALGKENGGLASALLLGNREGLSGRTVLSFRRAGISHLLALSGLHISILVGALEFLLRKLRCPKLFRLIAVPVFALLYLSLTGMALSTVRAVIMILLLYLAFLLQSSYDSVTALSVGLTGILLTMPYAVLDVSLWMSFAAAYAIVIFPTYFADFLEKTSILHGKKRLKRMLIALCVMIAVGIYANCAVLPLSAYYFGETSVFSVPATLLLSPFVTVALTASLLVLLFPTFSPLVWVLNKDLSFLTWVADRISEMQNAEWILTDVVTVVFLILLTLSLLFTAILPLRRKVFLLLPPILAGAVFCSAVCYLPEKSENGVSAEFLSGEDWEVLLFSNGERSVVVDTGGTSASSLYEIRDALREKHVTTVDAFVFTHFHTASSAVIFRSASVLKVRTFVFPTAENGEEEAILSRLREETEVSGSEVRLLSEGLAIPDVTVTFCERAKSDRAETGSLLSMKIGERNLVYLSGNWTEAEEGVVNNLVFGADVLVIGRHAGSDSAEKTLLPTLPKELTLLIFADENFAEKYVVPATFAKISFGKAKYEFFMGQSVFPVSETD